MTGANMLVVTGGAGFIGSALVWGLNRAGHDDILLVDRLGSDDRWKNLRGLRFHDLWPPEVFLGRFENESDLRDSVSCVFHLGANSSTTERDADHLYANNFVYARRLARACADTFFKSGKTRLVHASSAATYGDGRAGYDDDPARLGALRPLNMYGYSKQLFDVWARGEGMLGGLASLKFFNVYGPNEYHKGSMASLAYKAFGQIGETGKLRLFKSYRPEYSDGGQKRDFVYVKDVVDVMLWLMEHPEANGVFNVGSGLARSWNDLAAAVFAALGREAAIEYIDMPPELRPQYQYFTEAPLARLRAAGYGRPFTALEDGISDYIRGYLATDCPYLEC